MGSVPGWVLLWFGIGAYVDLVLVAAIFAKRPRGDRFVGPVDILMAVLLHLVFWPVLIAICLWDSIEGE